MGDHTKLNIPDDVLRLIIEAIASQSGKNDVLRLFLVSRSVKAWAEFHVYSKVVLKSEEQVLSFSAALNGDFAFCRPSRHVQRLWVLCPDSSATPCLSSVPKQCPNLVHFTFYGRRAPFIGSHADSNEQPRLTRLSICSPSVLDKELYKDGPPIPWVHLTHLHIFGSGDMNDSDLYNMLLGSRKDQLGSLKHLCIELTYPSPTTNLFNYAFMSEILILYLYVEEDLIHNLLVRLPQLRKVVIRTNFTYTRFRIFWDRFVLKFKDEPRVVFDSQALQNQDFLDNSLPYPKLSEAAWHRLLCAALDEVDQTWTDDD